MASELIKLSFQIAQLITDAINTLVNVAQGVFMWRMQLNQRAAAQQHADQVSQEMANLRQQFAALQAENGQLRQEQAQLRQENAETRADLRRLQARYDVLVDERLGLSANSLSSNER